MQNPNRRVVVIGAGAAGMMAAAEASLRGASVICLEKSGKTGVKILISGGTRCNITQATDAASICRVFGHARRFLQPSVGRLDPPAVAAMFENLGVPTKTESTGKIFPVSNRAADVRDALHRRMIDAGVELRLRFNVTDIVPVGGRWRVDGMIGGGKNEAGGPSPESLEADAVIVTSGGRSWPACGTVGDGYRWATRLGHTIVRPRPALVPLVGGTAATRELSGVAVAGVIATAFPADFSGDFSEGKSPGKRKPLALPRRGDLLLTHFGISGPAAMDVSGAITAAASPTDVQLRLDLIPDVSEPQLRERLNRRRGGGTVGGVVGGLLPARLAAALLPVDQPLAELSRFGADEVVQSLKAWHFPVTGTRGFEKAEVTAGGIDLAEVDRQTMASRCQRGLFLAGEILDVDGPIGGFNFQAAFATGKAAGIGAAAYVLSD